MRTTNLMLLAATGMIGCAGGDPVGNETDLELSPTETTADADTTAGGGTTSASSSSGESGSADGQTGESPRLDHPRRR